MKRLITVLIGGSALVGAASANFVETFDDLTDGFGTSNIAPLLGRGWVVDNESAPAGITSWYAGQTNYIAQDQDPTTNLVNPGTNVGYIAANYEANGSEGTIYDRLITPTLSLHNGDTLQFETISDGTSFPDRLLVGLSTNSDSIAIQSFSSVLVINPNIDQGGYPTKWTDYSITLSGLSSAGATGRFEFVSSVNDGGVLGSQSSYIGLDNVTVTPKATPEPASIAALGLGALALLRRRKNS